MLLSSSTLFVFVFFCCRQQRVRGRITAAPLGLCFDHAYVVCQRLGGILRRFWLLAHRCFGEYIRNFRENRAIPMRAKVVSIALMWGTMLYCIFGPLAGWRWAQAGLLAVAVGVTWHILSFATLRK